MLVDGGKAVHAQAVEDCLRSKSISTLDYVVASHPDEDHIGGLPQIYNRFQVNYSYYSPYKTNTKCYKNYLSAIKSEPGSKTANPTANSRFQVGGTTVQVLSDGTGAENANDASLVLKVQCGNRSLLLTGDISSTVEQSLVNSGTDLQTDILKVAHHGSAGSSSTSFLAEAAPKYAAISVGQGTVTATLRPKLCSDCRRLRPKFIERIKWAPFRCRCKTVEFRPQPKKAALPCASIGRPRKLQKPRRHPSTEMGARKPARSVRLAVTQRSLPLQRLLRCQRPSWQRRFILITARCKNRR